MKIQFLTGLMIAVLGLLSGLGLAQPLQVKSVVVQKSGQWADSRSSSGETRTQCATFKLSNQQALKWFRTAKQVDKETSRELLSWSNCYAKGILKTRDGHSYNWLLEPYGRGEIKLSLTQDIYFEGKDFNLPIKYNPQDPNVATTAVQALHGPWKAVFTCSTKVEVMGLGKRCADGIRDEFSFDLKVSGAKLTGNYELTDRIGQHVDDGDVADWSIKKVIGPKTFIIHYHVSGTMGEARLTVAGDKLNWHTLTHMPAPFEDDQEQAWTNQPPEDAVLIRQPAATAK